MGGAPSEAAPRRRSAQREGLGSPPVHVVPAAGARLKRTLPTSSYTKRRAFYFTCLDPAAPREALGRPLRIPAAEIADRLAEGFVIVDVPMKTLLPVGDFASDRARLALFAWRGRVERVQRDAEAEGEDLAGLGPS